MDVTNIEKVSSKLKKLPDSLLKEIENYIDFLAFRQSQPNDDIPQWHKDIVLKRVHEKNEPVDAFEMLDKLEAED
jgi:hypothetical protein